MTETEQLQLDYWTQFHALFRAQSTLQITPQPHARHWTEVTFGRSYCHFSVFMNTVPRNRQIGIQLVIEGPERANLFQQLFQQRGLIERVIGYLLHWEVPSGTKQKISLRWPGADPTDQAAWPAQHLWLIQTVGTFHSVFAPRL